MQRRAQPHEASDPLGGLPLDPSDARETYRRKVNPGGHGWQWKTVTWQGQRVVSITYSPVKAGQKE